MDKATNLSDVVTLEGELTTRETHLEQLLAQQSNLDNLVAMATITVHLTTAQPGGDDEPTTIGKAFRDGWHAFVTILRALVLFVGYTLPFLVLGGIVFLFVSRFNRRPRPPTGPPPSGRPQPASAGAGSASNPGQDPAGPAPIP